MCGWKLVASRKFTRRDLRFKLLAAKHTLSRVEMNKILSSAGFFDFFLSVFLRMYKIHRWDMVVQIVPL